MGKLKIALLVSFLPWILFPRLSNAKGDFETSYNVTYTIKKDGSCEVVQKISLTNLTDEYYASEHSLNVGNIAVENLWARDSRGSLSVNLVEKKESKVIETSFDRPVAGKGNTLNWELGFETDVATLHGSVLEVLLPGVRQQTGIKDYQINLRVSESYGKVAYVSPSPSKKEKGSDYQTLIFLYKDIQDQGVRAGFGDHQEYSLDLTYYLKNDTTQRAYTEIALVPDVPERQKIFYESIDPHPEEVRVDQDGNYLAKYFLAEEEQLKVNFKGKAFVTYKKKEIFNGADLNSIPQEITRQYTQAKEFWETENSRIQEIVRRVTSRQNSVTENAYALYNFVVSHLSYAEEKVGQPYERLGATAALEQENTALCSEYADLLVTLCRAAGIPARLVEGYAYFEDRRLGTEQSDVLHSWVEVYIPDVGWWAVDPTWGSTTGGAEYFSAFDFSHIVFAYKGLSSETPNPAGTYKFSPDQNDTINVNFLSEENTQVEEFPNLDVSIDLPSKHLAGWPLSGEVIIRNPGPQSSFSTTVRLVGKDIKVTDNREFTLGTIPPWSEKKIDFKIVAPWYKESAGQVEVGIGFENYSKEVTGKVLKKDITLQPFWYFLTTPYFLFPLGLGLLLAGVRWFFLGVKDLRSS
ncbi:MAG: transglutaminase-like domain-containing protein [Patescibacteria group bacterium]